MMKTFKQYLTEEFARERKSVVIKLKYSNILLYFDTDLDHAGREVYSMAAYNVDENNRPTDRFWHESYNKDFETKKQWNAAYNRYAKRAII